jgi:hypothetical protein
VTVHVHRDGTLVTGTDPNTGQSWTEYLLLTQILSSDGWDALYAEAAAVEAGLHPDAAVLSRYTGSWGHVQLQPYGPMATVHLPLGEQRARQRVTMHIHPERMFVTGVDPNTGQPWTQYVPLRSVRRAVRLPNGVHVSVNARVGLVEELMGALRAEQAAVEAGPYEGDPLHPPRRDSRGASRHDTIPGGRG